MRRATSLAAILVCLFALHPEVPGGQGRPTLSHDLASHSRDGDRVRVIVQAKPAALDLLRGTAGLRRHRDLGAALALEVSRDELARLAGDSAIDHISSDLPVRGDMAVTNGVTGASSVWQGSGGLLGLLGTPDYDGSGITVAVVDSGITPHSAVGDRVIARSNFVSFEPNVSGDPFGHGTRRSSRRSKRRRCSTTPARLRSRAHPEQAGQADAGRIRADEAPRADRRGDPVVDRVHLSGRADRAAPPRELGRDGLPTCMS